MRGRRVFRSLDRYIGIPLSLGLSLFDRIHPPSISTPESPSSILVIKLSAIGDTVLLIPSLRKLRMAYPDAYIAMVLTYVNSELLEDCPYLDEIIHLDIKRPLGLLGFIKGLRKRRFDLVLDFDQWLRASPLIAYLSLARRRIGFRTPGQYRHYLYTKAILWEERRHEVNSFFDIIRGAGVEGNDEPLELWVKDRDRATITEVLRREGVRDGDLLVGIHPARGTHLHPRKWREENYGYVADHLIVEYGVKVVFTGTKEDGEMVGQIISSMKEIPINMVGRTSIGELLALVERFSLLLCINTGVMHIAAALGTPVIALHGPDDPEKWGPWGEGHVVIRANLPCSPCSYLGFEYGCRRGLCMESITKEEVLSACCKKIEEVRRWEGSKRSSKRESG